MREARRRRVVALAVIACSMPLINPSWEQLYYVALLIPFAVIGWAQVKVGRVGHSRAELALLFCDLALLTLISLVPNPFSSAPWPVAGGGGRTRLGAGPFACTPSDGNALSAGGRGRSLLPYRVTAAKGGIGIGGHGAVVWIDAVDCGGRDWDAGGGGIGGAGMAAGEEVWGAA